MEYRAFGVDLLGKIDIVKEISVLHPTLMKDVAHLMELARLNRIYDPFYASKDSHELFRWLEDEVRESKKELEKGDFEALESEIGDILWNILNLMNKLEDEGKIDQAAMMEKINDKIERRKSFLLEKRKVTEDEAKEIWNSAKRREGYDESRLCWDI